jgi:hypothetical protein
LPVLPEDEDDDREREGAVQIAALIGKPIYATQALLLRGRVPGAYKFADKWRLRPSVWRRWRDEQEAASIARATAPIQHNSQPIRVRSHLRQPRRAYGTDTAAPPRPALVAKEIE